MGISTRLFDSGDGVGFFLRSNDSWSPSWLILEVSDFANSAARASSEKMKGSLSVNPEGVLLAIAKRKSKVENRFARVAKLADTPDLGLRNHRFQGHRFSFQSEGAYAGERRFFVGNRRDHES
ncbi:MAG: hypothetical protein DME60_05965 [Verrucomicrobia bacterium]|nr:MAG: hypothetical protein DME60_05965 [Verrucomicrobiota bacterium]